MHGNLTGAWTLYYLDYKTKSVGKVDCCKQVCRYSCCKEAGRFGLLLTILCGGEGWFRVKCDIFTTDWVSTMLNNYLSNRSVLLDFGPLCPPLPVPVGSKLHLNQASSFSKSWLCRLEQVVAILSFAELCTAQLRLILFSKS